MTALIAVASISLLAALLGLVLGYASVKFHVDGDPIADQIDALLPQTQCGQCTYAGCRPYAEAIAAGEADINQCPPGGEATITAIADLLGVDPKPLNDSHGETPKEPMVAVVIEKYCIGCTLCIQACPVDAIVGAAKQIHSVVEDECTGCELCIEPCPVACIEMVPRHRGIGDWTWPAPDEKLYLLDDTASIHDTIEAARA
ncbi:MAG: electron transport complex subunit RsxB [bacterium]